MAEENNSIELKSGTRLFIGNLQIVLPNPTDVVIESAHSIDAVAELLAGNNPTIYAEHRDQLAHIENRTDEAGNAQQIRVTYGVGGSRIEEVIEPEFAIIANDIQPAPRGDGKIFDPEFEKLLHDKVDGAAPAVTQADVPASADGEVAPAASDDRNDPPAGESVN